MSMRQGRPASDCGSGCREGARRAYLSALQQRLGERFDGEELDVAEAARAGLGAAREADALDLAQ